MAKKATFADKTKLASFLESIRDGGTKRLDGKVSYHLLRKLAADGYLVRGVADTKKEKGRHAKPFLVSGKGKSLIGAMKGIQKAAENRAAKQAATAQAAE